MVTVGLKSRKSNNKKIKVHLFWEEYFIGKLILPLFSSTIFLQWRPQHIFEFYCFLHQTLYLNHAYKCPSEEEQSWMSLKGREDFESVFLSLPITSLILLRTHQWLHRAFRLHFPEPSQRTDQRHCLLTEETFEKTLHISHRKMQIKRWVSYIF